MSDVSKEMVCHRERFRGKTVFLNCDDPVTSAFWEYFHLNFGFLGLKRLIATHYDKDKPTYKLEYCGGDDNEVLVGYKTALIGDGDFRSDECREILKSSDIVVTNPPFSLAREFIETLITEGKSFLIVGALPWLGYSQIFPLIRDNKVWTGINDITEFIRPDGTFRHIGFGLWVTNLDNERRHKRLELRAQFSSEA